MRSPDNDTKQTKAEYDREYRKKNVEKIRKYQEDNKEQRSKFQSVWRKDNPEQVARTRILYNHGITLDEYDEMVLAQNNTCAICSNPPGGRWKKLYIDHCHQTGRIRGLLCHNCNLGLGNFRDSPKSLIKASEYIQRVI